MNKRSLSAGRDLLFQTQVRHNLKRNNIKPMTGRALLFKTQVRCNPITSNAITSNPRQVGFCILQSYRNWDQWVK